MSPLPYPVSPDPYSRGWQGVQQLSRERTDGNDPSVPIGAYYLQQARWQVMRVVLEGNHYLRGVAHEYINKLPNETDECYQRRLSSALFSPYVARIVDAAIGLILRKPIVLEGGNEAYWEEWAKDVDRQGTDLNEFARKILRSSIGYGHCGILVDFPKAEGIRTLADERQARLAPYLHVVEPFEIIGWRQDPRESAGELQQVRIREVLTEASGEFGEEVIQQIRVLEPGRYRVFRKDKSGKWTQVEQGQTSLSEIPLAVTYSDKDSTLVSTPPLLDVGYLNLAHYRLQSQHLNALQVAGFPLLVLKGWDDQQQELHVDVSKALAMPPDGSVEYVEPANAAFDAYQKELEELATQMSNLGISILAEQKRVAESGLSKQLDRADTNSLLATISMDLEQTLQRALGMAGEYAGQEPPRVGLPRDFDVKAMDGGEIGAVNQLFTSGLLDQETALRLLKQGELIPDDMEIEDILSASENEELHDLEMQVKRTEEMAKIGEGTPEENKAGGIKTPEDE